MRNDLLLVVSRNPDELPLPPLQDARLIKHLLSASSVTFDRPLFFDILDEFADVLLSPGS